MATRKLFTGLKTVHGYDITNECLWHCVNCELLTLKNSHKVMCIHTVYARHPDEMFHIYLFNASVLIHIVYNSKKMPNLGPLYGIELGI